MGRRLVIIGAAAGLAASGGCDTVDVGAPLAEVNACRPKQAFFVEQIWPNFLARDYGGKHCYDGGCHDAASGRALVLTPPTSAAAVPLPPDWAAIYRSATEQLRCTNVDASPLLMRPDGRQTHGGEKLIEPNGPEATLVKMWVVAR
jgi:hypothetical protein